jgi:ABC-type taurine transport system ATPase subunit
LAALQEKAKPMSTVALSVEKLESTATQTALGQPRWSRAFLRRLAVRLASLAASRPRVMLMDEPTSALDAQTRLLMQDLLLHVWSEYRMTGHFVTHDIDEPIYLGSRVAVLTRRPGCLKALFEVDLPRPRTMAETVSTQFMKLKRICMDLVREETIGWREHHKKNANETDTYCDLFLARYPRMRLSRTHSKTH